MHSTDAAYHYGVVSMSVCLSVGHTDVLCKNGGIDRDAV